MKRRRKNPPEPASPPEGARQVSREELLAGVPTLHPAVEMMFNKRHGFHLSWANPTPPGKRRAWFPWMRPTQRHRLALDAMGRRTVELMDGRSPLKQIAAQLAGESGHKTDDMEKALLAFVTQLVKRNAVQLVAAGLCASGRDNPSAAGRRE